MFRFKILLLTIATLSTLLPGTAPIALAQKDKKDQEVRGTPVLWHNPVDIRSRNLRFGPGGARLKPDLRRVTFIEEEKGGYSTKYRVKDARGNEWVAKVSKEAQSETASVRLLWAVGYMTEIVHLEPTTEIIGKGVFHNVRFEARPANMKRLDEWKWADNPFVNTREFKGLKVMMALLNNWDIKDSNNKIIFVPGNAGNELRYVISDLGATFGQSGSTPILWRITRSRNDPKDFAKAEFVDVVKDNRVYFHYGGKRNDLFDDITVADARWIGGLLAQLSQQQLRDAFRAANYSPSQITLLVNEIRQRTNELQRVREQNRR